MTHSGRVFFVDAEGQKIGSEADAADLIGALYGSEAEWVAIPLLRLDDDILLLSNRRLGLFLQKLINYRLQVVIIGDVSGATATSTALNDFVVESNRGESVWFVPDRASFERRLQARGWAAR